jgi:ribonuclease P protein component
MLPAALRLSATTQITATLRAGRRHASPYFVLHVVKTNDSNAKFAFAVNKKVGNSVVRHRITRQLREIVQQNLAGVPVGSHIVVRALPQIRQASYAQLSQAFSETIGKVN